MSELYSLKSIYLAKQSYIRKLYCEVVANHAPTFHSGIPIAGEVEEKEELKNLLKWGKW